MGAFRRGQDAFTSGELCRRLKYRSLFHTDGPHQALVIQLGQNRAHAMVAQAARVVGGRNETAAQGIHLGQGTYHTGITEIIGVSASCQAGAAGRLHRHDIVVRFSAQLLTHERRDQAAQIGAAARAADDHIRLDTVFIQGDLSLESDDGLMQQDLVEHRSQHITVSFMGNRVFNRL